MSSFHACALPEQLSILRNTDHTALSMLTCADDSLHYGQKLRIMANPMVQGESLDASGGSRALYLYSRHVSTTHFAKLSRHQLVAFTDRASYDSVWQVSHGSHDRVRTCHTHMMDTHSLLCRCGQIIIHVHVCRTGSNTAFNTV